MSVKEHYDNHLGNFYTWMVGDLRKKQDEFQQFLVENELYPVSTKIALDLGAGNGLQSIPLARAGYAVKAIDFNRQLIAELKENSKGMDIEIYKADIKEVGRFAGLDPELVVCCGDTLSHLDSMEEISCLFSDLSQILNEGGKILLTFRDYSAVLSGSDRFIPVRSDENRILTCFLEYETDHVQVTDLLYERSGEGWIQKISSYKKVRVSAHKVASLLESYSFNIQMKQLINGMITIIATNGHS